MKKRYLPEEAYIFSTKEIISDSFRICKLSSENYIQERLLIFLNTLKVPFRITKWEIAKALEISPKSAYRALYGLKDGNLIDYDTLRDFGYLITRVAQTRTLCPYGMDDCSACLLKMACDKGQGVSHE